MESVGQKLRDARLRKNLGLENVSAETRIPLKILEAIESLPDEEREVFDLVRIQGMTQPEAALTLGVSAKTVQRRLNRPHTV